MDEAIRAAQRKAEEAPGEPWGRRAYAEVLLRAGYRAAAWHEWSAGLGGEREEFAIERGGEVWRFFEAGTGVAAPIEDSRYPGARVRAKGRVLPLVVVLGRACDCPEVEVCADCNGRGLVPDSLDNYVYDPWGLAPCPKCSGGRSVCERCFGCGFLVGAVRAPCGHASVSRERDQPGVTIWRCTVCGLAAGEFGSSGIRFACGRCGLFDCAC